MPHRFTIGRDRASDIAIADDSVSRTHADIWLEDDGTLMLADHGSSNGTELIRAGETSALTKAAVLPGDQVRFGAVTLAVKDLIDAIEAKSPGALTGSGSRSRAPQAAKPAPPVPPPLPPIPDRPKASPPVTPPPPERAVAQSPPPLPKPNVAPPPLERAAAPPPPPIPDRQQVRDPVPPQRPVAGPPASPIVRCECGAIKTQGQVCPGCHR